MRHIRSGDSGLPGLLNCKGLIISPLPKRLYFTHPLRLGTGISERA